MKKALSVGVENFEDMVKSGYYYVVKCYSSSLRAAFTYNLFVV